MLLVWPTNMNYSRLLILVIIVSKKLAAKLFTKSAMSKNSSWTTMISAFQVRPNTLLFYQIETLKNGPSLILPSSIARKSSAPEAKRIFEILWGILEGCTNSARPYRPCLKNCQNGTFWSVHGIWIFFAKWLHLRCY